MIDLDKVGRTYWKGSEKYKKRVIICAGTGCMANGAMEFHDELVELASKQGINLDVFLKTEAKEESVLLSKSGCQGFCQQGPLLEIQPDNILYTHVKKEDAQEILEKTIVGDQVIDRLLYVNGEGCHCRSRDDVPFYNLQKRTILKKCGAIDPEDIREYIGLGGYQAAKKVYQQMNSKEICEEMVRSGLRGRGGGGFSTGLKWQFTLKEDSKKKYVICNGDEGDPGAFMDRSLLEGTPHSIIEGMMIAAKGIDADEGYIYVRMEYPLAVKRMRRAIEEAEKLGLLGENIFDSDRSFKLTVMEGAGAFVCGEETALIASIQGKRGMPMPKPPFPAQKGLFGKPTVINNVETLATVPKIFLDGADAYRKDGNEKSPGTKTFALTGHVANTGLIEVELGTTLREIIFNIGGGVTDENGEVDNSRFKAVQIGGPSGGCLTKEHLDLPLDFDSIPATGAIIGSGGLVVMNDTTCMIKDVARFFMEFTQEESCGKCVPCRDGTRQMLHILEEIIEGRGTMEMLDLLQELGHAITKGSLCGLGKTAANPVLSTLRYFKDEYLSHVVDKKCGTKSCSVLSPLFIDPEKCIGCTACARKCPVNAISGDKKELHVIDADKCIKCNVCIETCRFNAIA